MGKGEIARNKQFLLFPQCFQLYHITVFPFIHIFDFKSLFAVELEEPKIGISGKELKEFAYNRSKVHQMVISVTCRIENNAGKKKNTPPFFFLFPLYPLPLPSLCLSCRFSPFTEWKKNSTREHLRTAIQMFLKSKNLQLTISKTNPCFLYISAVQLF